MESMHASNFFKWMETVSSTTNPLKMVSFDETNFEGEKTIIGIRGNTQAFIDSLENLVKELKADINRGEKEIDDRLTIYF